MTTLYKLYDFYGYTFHLMTTYPNQFKMNHLEELKKYTINNLTMEEKHPIEFWNDIFLSIIGPLFNAEDHNII